MPEDVWTDEDEAKWKSKVKALFSEKLQEALKQHGDPLAVGDKLGELLRTLEKDAAKLVIPRAVSKWASTEHLSQWDEILQNETMLSELRAIGTSVANTMRPLAGNTFASWVSEVLNRSFEHHKLPMSARTKGKDKTKLSRRFVVKDGGHETDLRPDIDIVVFHEQRVDRRTKRVPVAIISVKTTLAERVMQTINWTRYKTDERLPEDVRNVRLYLVTAWETFPEGDVNRDRVQELDGVYVCNTEFQPHGKIKPFAQILEDLKSLLPDQPTSSS